MALLDMLKNRNPNPEPVPGESPHTECYICRRSEEEITALTTAMTEEVNMKILLLRNKIGSKKDEVVRYYQSMINRLAGNEYLDFKIETIKTDIPQFSRKIPNVNEILQKSHSDSETIAVVVDRLRDTIHQISMDPEYDISQDYPEIQEAYNEIRSLEEEKQVITDALKIRSRALHIGNGGQVTVHLCGICSGLLAGSSSAPSDESSRN